EEVVGGQLVDDVGAELELLRAGGQRLRGRGGELLLDDGGLRFGLRRRLGPPAGAPLPGQDGGRLGVGLGLRGAGVGLVAVVLAGADRSGLLRPTARLGRAGGGAVVLLRGRVGGGAATGERSEPARDGRHRGGGDDEDGEEAARREQGAG